MKYKIRWSLPGDNVKSRLWCLAVVKRGWSVNYEENVILKPSDGRDFGVSKVASGNFYGDAYHDLLHPHLVV